MNRILGGHRRALFIDYGARTQGVKAKKLLVCGYKWRSFVTVIYWSLSRTWDVKDSGNPKPLSIGVFVWCIFEVELVWMEVELSHDMDLIYTYVRQVFVAPKMYFAPLVGVVFGIGRVLYRPLQLLIYPQNPNIKTPPHLRL